MEENPGFIPPTGDEDTKGAQRVFEDFYTLYQPTLIRTEHYLQQIIEQLEPEYAEAYRPWHKALRDLLQGVYLTVRKVPLPDAEDFLESLRIFSFDSAIQFLHDLCISCRLILPRNWADDFRRHINSLLFSAAILNRQQQALAR